MYPFSASCFNPPTDQRIKDWWLENPAYRQLIDISSIFCAKKNVNEPETSYLLQVSNHIDLELKIFPSEDNHHKKMPLLELQMSRWL